MEQILKETIERFNKKVGEDPRLAAELAGMRRVVQIDVTDGEKYYFVLDDSSVGPLVKGTVDSPDIRISASRTTLEKLFSGELRPMKALATRQVRVSASLEDMLRIRKLF